MQNNDYTATWKEPLYGSYTWRDLIAEKSSRCAISSRKCSSTKRANEFSYFGLLLRNFHEGTFHSTICVNWERLQWQQPQKRWSNIKYDFQNIKEDSPNYINFEDEKQMPQELTSISFRYSYMPTPRCTHMLVLFECIKVDTRTCTAPQDLLSSHEYFLCISLSPLI